ncbi:MAG TPA: YwqG family protein [Gallionellaceae bacterium]
MNLMEMVKTLQQHQRPALHVIPAPAPGAFSKIGGLPNLPSAIAWPEWGAQPMSFLAQIDLAELPQPSPLPELPASGYLYFFYDAEQSTWGFDPKDRGSWAVVYSAGTPAPETRPAPDELPEEGLFLEQPVMFSPILSIPDLQRLELPGSDSDDEDEAFEKAQELREEIFGGRPQHQIGGYPNPIQNDTMEIECQLASNGLYLGDSSGYEDPRAKALMQGAEDWRLLFQIDTDDDAGMMWGDCGMIYFWIRAADLARKDFSNVWMVLQCS